jgi:hypothetical protein
MRDSVGVDVAQLAFSVYIHDEGDRVGVGIGVEGVRVVGPAVRGVAGSPDIVGGIAGIVGIRGVGSGGEVSCGWFEVSGEESD